MLGEGMKKQLLRIITIIVVYEQQALKSFLGVVDLPSRY